MRRIFTFLFFFILIFTACGEGFKYPEFTPGVRIVVRDSVETSLGTLKSYGIYVDENHYYILLELRNKGLVKASALFRLGKNWGIKVGRETAVVPISIDLILKKALLIRAPYIADLINSIKEAFEITSPGNEWHGAYAGLYFLLTTNHLSKLHKTSTTSEHISKISCDQCESLRDECMYYCRLNQDNCIQACQIISDPSERDKCVHDCIKTCAECVNNCILYWLKCKLNCTPPPK